MLKNLRKKAPEKDKIGAGLFKYTTVAEHGFPHKPSAIAYDPTLQLLAIGTRTGQLKIFGQPGVELIGQDSSTVACIQQLFFLPNEGRVISVCDDGEQNSLHLWEINNPYGKNSILEEVKACTLEGRLKKISVCCLSTSRECLYIGTEGGHIYTLDLKDFELKDHVIYQDIVMQSLTVDLNKSGGSVEGLQEHPTDPGKLLIGYKKGIIVLWNQDKIKAEGTFIATQDVESIYWHNGSEQFISAHEHGSLSVWSLTDGTSEVKQDSSTPFGPFPCKAIRKVEWHDNLVLFTGGLPRASYGDKHSISVLQDNTVQVVLDFTSKIIDFFSIQDSSNPSGKPLALVVLCDEEVVVIDVNNNEKSFPSFNKPYLSCIHSSNITSSHHIVNCPDDLWTHINKAGREQTPDVLTAKDWPVVGGTPLLPVSEQHDLMLTGHEDGSVKFWDVSTLSFKLLYTISTSRLFESDSDGPPPDDEEDDWPPFKKVGNFDPYSDDPRFVIQKLLLCPVSKTLFVGGSGGQLIIYELKEQKEDISTKIEISHLNVIESLEGFEWKGLGPLTVHKSAPKSIYGPVPKRVLQIKPSAPITALAMETAWGLVAAGTCHGLIVYDILSNKVALTKCTVNPTDLANTGAGIQRKRTLAKSLRDSFRRLKSRRGSRRNKPKTDDGSVPNSPAQSAPRYEVAPQSRLIDENRVDEAVLSMVRCLYFGQTFLGDGAHATPTLWAGTNAGYIYVYSVSVPEKDERTATSIKTEVGKELKLKHHAPVVNIFVVDKNGVPISSIAEAETGRVCQWDMSGGHSVVISSEEQFKIFSLPGLRPRNKYKLTAVDGSRVRKLGVVEIKDKQDQLHHCLVCLTNQGDTTIFSVPQLKPQMKTNIVKKEDISAISSLIITRLGEGFFLKSPSELQRFCLVASNTLTSDTIIKLAHGMRPDEEMLSEGTDEPQSPTSLTSTNGNHNHTKLSVSAEE